MRFVAFSSSSLLLLLLLSIATAQAHDAKVRLNDDGSGGIYGQWQRDANGLPTFAFDMDELTDPDASWPNSRQSLRPPYNVTTSNHFYLFGNRRINVQVSLSSSSSSSSSLSFSALSRSHINNGHNILGWHVGIWATPRQWTMDMCKCSRTIVEPCG
jgi:hypothetical protein